MIQELREKPAVEAQATPSQEAETEPQPAPAPSPPSKPQVQPASPPSAPRAQPPAKRAGEPEPPPPPAKSLTQEPAVETRTAALPPAGALPERTRVIFAQGSAQLSEEAMARLQGVAQALTADASLRIQLLAYAKGTGDTSSRARRLSLSRALAVRAFLIEKGVRSTRMDVRALGDKASDGPLDRVDILPQPAGP